MCEKMPFVCEICPKSFSVKRSLIRHVDSRHKKIKVFCTQCNKPFSRSDSLAHHINTMHPVKVERKASEPKRRQKKTVNAKALREQVRVKRERKRLPPPEAPTFPLAEEFCPPPPSQAGWLPPVEAPDFPAAEEYSPPPPPSSQVEEFIRIPLHPLPGIPRLPKMDFSADQLPEVSIKTEMQVEVEPCIVINCEEDFAATPKSEALDEPAAFTATPPQHSPDKQKRFNAADELDFTVLDLMQQNAIDAKDEDRMFLLSILSDFKRVPVEKKLKVKARIVGVIVDALD